MNGRTSARLRALMIVAMGLLGPAGCYRHVVRTDGPGTGQIQVHEPNLRDDLGINGDKSAKKVPSPMVPNTKVSSP